jgi:molecular chaperone DnaK
MKYVGIDLGTTNSAICSYDGEETKLYKSPEQHDVTPSAIFIDKRGNKYVGSRAYNNAARNPNSAATLFKRFMGTSTVIKLSAVDLEMTPEECSIEILKTLFGYLPEEIRNDQSTGIVITVPAAFNQMQKDATMSAAHEAGLGSVALMQEPVAAVMSVMRSRKSDGIFLVYDLGGGTLDIAVAESTSGRVNLLGHGGIAMCGGRDFDRILFDNIIKPWLFKNFNLPENIYTNSDYKALVNMSTWAGEKAKIELSQRDEAIISLPETELGVKDLDGEEIYIDIPITRDEFDRLIEPKVMESIQAARDTLEKVGLTPHDVERIVFVGGPTNYKPLHDKVSFELGIAASTEVNRMTAVAEGAAIFAESIDWKSEGRGRKSSRGNVKTGSLELSFNYISRTPDVKARIVAKIPSPIDGAEFQIDSLDTGWSSGKIKLIDGASLELILAKPGDNVFKIFVFDPNGGPLSLATDKIIITRTAASIDAIPSSSSIGVEALDKLGGSAGLVKLVNEGDHLPKKGQIVFKSSESLRAGSSGAYRFKMWEGEIKDPITDNKFIGTFEIKGSDFDDGIIPAGAELICDYEVLDSGNIVMEVSIPSISGLFHSNRSFYSRQEGQIDYADAAKIIEDESNRMMNRIDEMAEKVDDPRLQTAKNKLESARENSNRQNDPETTKQALDDIQESKKSIAKIRQEHLKTIRQMELDGVKGFFDDMIRKYAKPAEESSFDNLARTAQGSIENSRKDFESQLQELRGKNFDILWKQDWFVIDRFKHFAQSPHLYANHDEFIQLVGDGEEALKNDDMQKLKSITGMLFGSRMSSSDGDDMIAAANIIRG